MRLIRFFFAAVFQWIGEKQKEFEVNSMQLLYYQAPMSAVILMLFVPFFEPLTGPKGVFSPEWTLEGLVSLF
jgi:solute carrier family 35 protein E3